MATPSSALALQSLMYGPKLARKIASLGPVYKQYAKRIKTGYKTYKNVRRGLNSVKRNLFKGMSLKNMAGDPPGPSSCKRQRTGFQNNLEINTRELYPIDLTNIVRESSDNAQDKREQEEINVSGFKICMDIKHSSGSAMHCNVAVISPRGCFDISETSFFRGSEDKRGKDFSTALSSLEFRCLPINTDRYFVLRHHRFLLGAVNDSVNNGELDPSYVMEDFWVKYNRQVRYQDGVAISGRVYLVFWFDRMHTEPASAKETAVITLSYRTISYFREP